METASLPDVKIRAAQTVDRGRVMRLKPSLAEASLERRLRETREGNALFIVAERGDRLVGHVFLKFYGKPNDGSAPDVEDLYVHPDWRSQGVGTALLQACETVARLHGHDAIQLSVGVQNKGAQRLYTRLGYVNTGREPYLGGVYNGKPEWVIDLKKPLDPASERTSP